MIAGAIVFAVFVLVIGGIGAGIYFAVRGQGGSENFTFRNLLRAYLRLAYLVSLFVFMAGAVMTLTAAFGAVVGHDFSYNTFYSHGSSTICQPAPYGSTQNCVTQTQGDDPRQQEDLIRGLSLMVAGLVIGGAHRFGQLSMETEDERKSSGLTKTEYLIGTVGFGVVSIFALPAAAYSVLTYNLVSHSATNSGGDIPGPTLAVALVFLPAWVYYLVSFVRRVRSSTPAAAEHA
ncbi:MAG TPA: hypothetical protein VNV65_10240 [Candidatus Solibacter sp.]|jgi:hypothetical protein|nr:hypothetical protein [Candidatus Solibacter sp.]